MTLVEPAPVRRMICPLPKPQTVPPPQGIPVGSVYSTFPVSAWNSSLVTSAQASAGACALTSPQLCHQDHRGHGREPSRT